MAMTRQRKFSKLRTNGTREYALKENTMTAASKTVVTELAPDSEEWRLARKNYLGASDAPAALGISRWCSMRRLAELKKGMIESEAESKIQHRGHVLEPYLREHVRGIIHSSISAPAHCVHPEHPWMAATPDGLVGDDALLELKTVNIWAADEWGEPGSADIPDIYFCQVQHQLAVTGRVRCVVYALFADEKIFDLLVRMAEDGVDIGGYLCELDIRAYTVERDEDFIAYMIAQECEFWTRYIEGEELPPDYLHCKVGTVRAATAEEMDYVLETALPAWKAAKQTEVALEEVKARLQNQIKDAGGIDCGSLGKITWSRSGDKTVISVDWEAVALELAERLELRPGEEEFEDIVKVNTTTEVKSGGRRFCWPRVWSTK